MRGSLASLPRETKQAMLVAGVLGGIEGAIVGLVFGGLPGALCGPVWGSLTGSVAGIPAWRILSAAKRFPLAYLLLLPLCVAGAAWVGWGATQYTSWWDVEYMGMMMSLVVGSMLYVLPSLVIVLEAILIPWRKGVSPRRMYASCGALVGSLIACLGLMQLTIIHAGELRQIVAWAVMGAGAGACFGSLLGRLIFRATTSPAGERPATWRSEDR
jgi:hypothetical protein